MIADHMIFLSCRRRVMGKRARTSLNLPCFAPFWKEQSSSYVQNPRTPRQLLSVGRADRLKSRRRAHLRFSARILKKGISKVVRSFVFLTWLYCPGLSQGPDIKSIAGLLKLLVI